MILVILVRENVSYVWAKERFTLWYCIDRNDYVSCYCKMEFSMMISGI